MPVVAHGVFVVGARQRNQALGRRVDVTAALVGAGHRGVAHHPRRRLAAPLGESGEVGVLWIDRRGPAVGHLPAAVDELRPQVELDRCLPLAAVADAVLLVAPVAHLFAHQVPVAEGEREQVVLCQLHRDRLGRVVVATVAVQEDQPLEAIAVDAERHVADHGDEGLELQGDGPDLPLVVVGEAEGDLLGHHQREVGGPPRGLEGDLQRAAQVDVDGAVGAVLLDRTDWNHHHRSVLEGGVELIAPQVGPVEGARQLSHARAIPDAILEDGKERVPRSS